MLEISTFDLKKSKKYKDTKTVKILEETLRKKEKYHENWLLSWKTSNFGKTICQNVVAMETLSHVIKGHVNPRMQVFLTRRKKCQ